MLYSMFAAVSLKGLDVHALVDELRERMYDELDYRLEAICQTEFVERYAGHPFIRIPKVVPELSAERVLTTEWIDGINWTDFEATATYEQQQKEINAWMVGLAAGPIEGAPLRLAVEMARVVDDGTNLLVLPIVRLGTTERLYLRGADLAIINSGACSLLARAERLECLEKLSHDIAPPPRPTVSPSPD